DDLRGFGDEQPFGRFPDWAQSDIGQLRVVMQSGRAGSAVCCARAAAQGLLVEEPQPFDRDRVFARAVDDLLQGQRCLSRCVHSVRILQMATMPRMTMTERSSTGENLRPIRAPK